MGRERVLIVEDDARLARALADELSRGYDTAIASTGREALFLAETEVFDLVLLDLNLPDMDGIEVAEQLEGNPADIVMLTARGDVPSRVRGLYAGAGDYLVKPFAMEELLARVYARMRARALPEAHRWGALTLVVEDRSCSYDGRAIDLSAQEYRLLELLLEHQGRVFSKHTLVERLYADDTPAANAVEVLVSRVRKKLEAVGAGTVVHTIRGLGYVVRRHEA
jgi:DNA-binding response OmpR family regulator